MAVLLCFGRKFGESHVARMTWAILWGLLFLWCVKPFPPRERILCDSVLPCRGRESEISYPCSFGRRTTPPASASSRERAGARQRGLCWLGLPSAPPSPRP